MASKFKMVSGIDGSFSGRIILEIKKGVVTFSGKKRGVEIKELHLYVLKGVGPIA